MKWIQDFVLKVGIKIGRHLSYRLGDVRVMVGELKGASGFPRYPDYKVYFYAKMLCYYN